LIFANIRVQICGNLLWRIDFRGNNEVSNAIKRN